MGKKTVTVIMYISLLFIGFGSLYVDRYVSPEAANWSPVFLVLWVTLLSFIQGKAK